MSGWVGGGETLYCLVAVLPSELNLEADCSTVLSLVEKDTLVSSILVLSLELFFRSLFREAIAQLLSMISVNISDISAAMRNRHMHGWVGGSDCGL